MGSLDLFGFLWIIDRDRDHDKALVRVFLVHVDQMGKRFSARRTKAGPEVDQHNLAALAHNLLFQSVGRHGEPRNLFLLRLADANTTKCEQSKRATYLCRTHARIPPGSLDYYCHPTVAPRKSPRDHAGG